MQHLRLLVLAYVLLVCETSLTGRLADAAFPVSLWTLAALAAVIALPGGQAVACAGLVGLAADCLSAGRLGICLVACVATAMIWQAPGRGVRRASPLAWAGMAFFLSLAGHAGHLAELSAGDQPVAWRSEMGTAIVGAAFTAVVAWAAAAAWTVCSQRTSAKRLAPQRRDSRGYQSFT